MAKCFLTSVLWLMLVVLTAAPALGIVEGVESDELFHKPGSGWWYGMNWDYVHETGEATSVAIGYFSLLTARHYWPGHTFNINGDEFEVTGTLDLPRTEGDLPDLRVIKLRNNTESARPLPGFYQLYTGSFNGLNENMVVVGTGYSGEIHSLDRYSEDANTGRAKRWGTNKYTQTLTRENGSYATKCLHMNFRRGDTTYECGYGEHDSGGGVFLKPYGEDEWKLAGINLYRAGRQPNFGDIFAASIPEYADTLHDFLSTDLLPGDADLNGRVDAMDYLAVKRYLGTTSGASWENGDFNGDGAVDRDDYHAVVVNFGYTSTPHPIMTPPGPGGPGGGAPGDVVPEPTILSLLAVGALALVRRRPR